MLRGGGVNLCASGSTHRLAITFGGSRWGIGSLKPACCSEYLRHELHGGGGGLDHSPCRSCSSFGSSGWGSSPSHRTTRCADSYSVNEGGGCRCPDRPAALLPRFVSSGCKKPGE